VLGVALPFAMALASVPAYPAIAQNWWLYSADYWQPFIDPQVFLSGGAVVFALTFTRLRRLTALAAWLCALAQLLIAADLVLPALPDLTGAGLRLCWPALSVLAAAALTVVAAQPRAGGAAAQATRSGPDGAGLQAAARSGEAGRAGGRAGRRAGGRVGGMGLLGVVLAVAVEFVALQSITFTIDDRALLGAVGAVGRWVLVVGAVVVPAVAVGLVVRRAGVAVGLRVLGVAAGVAVLFQGAGNVLWYEPVLPYGPFRWVVLPLLAFALPVLAARLVERRAARRHDPADRRGRATWT
jgi:hypothetical protein